MKQGMYTQYAESALKNVAEVVNSVRYDLNVAKNTITALIPQIETRGDYIFYYHKNSHNF